MRQTTFSKPPAYTGHREQRWLNSGAKGVLTREARVKARREAGILISEALDADFEPVRDFAAEWEQATLALYESALDNYPCGCCRCCGHDDACHTNVEWQAQQVEFAAMAHFFETGEFLPV